MQWSSKGKPIQKPTFKKIVLAMPIQIQDYEWSQTPTSVIIKVPLKGVPGHKADIFSTDLYVKVSIQSCQNV